MSHTSGRAISAANVEPGKCGGAADILDQPGRYEPVMDGPRPEPDAGGHVSSRYGEFTECAGQEKKR